MKTLFVLMVSMCIVLLFTFPYVLKAQDIPDPGDPVPVDPQPDPEPPSNNSPESPSPNSNTMQNAVALAVCANEGDVTSACVEEAKNKAGEELGKLMLKTFVMGSLDLDNRFRLIIPNVYPQYAVVKMLIDIENAEITQTVAIVKEDIGKLRAFGGWPTTISKDQALLIIQKDEITIAKWNKEATEEANKGDHWVYDGSESQNSSYKFCPGSAYEQLKTISSLGWLK